MSCYDMTNDSDCALTVHSSNTTSGMDSLHDLDFDIHKNYDDREDFLPPLQEASENTGGGANSTSQRPSQAAADESDSAASEDTASVMETDSAASTVLVNGQWKCEYCDVTNEESNFLFCHYCGQVPETLEDRTIQQQPPPAEVQIDARRVERGVLKHDSTSGASLSVFDKFRCGSGSPPTKKMKSCHQDGAGAGAGAEVEIMRSNETEINSRMKQQLRSDGGSLLNTHQNLRQFDPVCDVNHAASFHSSFACGALESALNDLDKTIWDSSPSVDESNQPPPLDEIEVQNNPEVEQQPPPALAPLDEIEVQNNHEGEEMQYDYFLL